MKILWLTWKDKKHPLAGGAEVVSSELAKRLAADGHEVVILTSHFQGATLEKEIDGCRVIRRGNRFSVYWHAFRYVRRHLADWPDLVVEEVNTFPFFSRFYLRRTPRILFFHQLCRKIWFYQMKFPFSAIGWLLEPLYLRLLGDERLVTVSESTRRDLARHGFDASKISIISEGIQIEPAEIIASDKTHRPTIVSLGAVRSMKRTLDQIKAFEIAKRDIPELQLKLAGKPEGAYGKKVMAYIRRSPFAHDIEYLGWISQQEKQELMRVCHLITVTSVKEGWGLIVTEAASQGTPAAVYDVDGLRDSVKNGETGLVTAENPGSLAQAIVTLLSDTDLYKKFQHNAHAWSKEINFTNSYDDFTNALRDPLLQPAAAGSRKVLEHDA